MPGRLTLDGTVLIMATTDTDIETLTVLSNPPPPPGVTFAPPGAEFERICPGTGIAVSNR